MSDYETLFFWANQYGSGQARMILASQNDSGKPECFWCITRPVMDPGPRPLARTTSLTWARALGP